MAYSFHLDNECAKVIALAAQGSQNSAWRSPFAADGTAGNGTANAVVYMIDIGTVTDDVDMKLTQATDSAGTGAKDITGAVLTTITTANDNKIATIELRPDNMDDKNGFKWVRAEVTVASGTPPYSVIEIKHSLRYPGAGTQDSTYDEQVEILT